MWIKFQQRKGSWWRLLWVYSYNIESIEPSDFGVAITLRNQQRYIVKGEAADLVKFLSELEGHAPLYYPETEQEEPIDSEIKST